MRLKTFGKKTLVIGVEKLTIVREFNVKNAYWVMHENV